MLNHKWNKDNECIKCKIYREKQTVKTLMSLQNNKPVYKYETKYRYFNIDTETFARPICWRKTYCD